MSKAEVELIRYKMDRARETLQEARLLLDAGHDIATVNRLYYACFYAVQSLLLTDGLSASKHTGIRSLFNQHWIKTGGLPVAFGDLYNDLFDHRQKGDYADFVRFDIADVNKWFEEAIILINEISSKVEKKIKTKRGKEDG